MLPLLSMDFVDIIKTFGEKIILAYFTYTLRGRQRETGLQGNEAEVRAMYCSLRMLAALRGATGKVWVLLFSSITSGKTLHRYSQWCLLKLRVKGILLY